MARRTRTPNLDLERLLDQAKWSRSQFAIIVNRLGEEAGLALHYDQSAVSHWVSGTVPNPPVRRVIVEAFSRKLQRPVTHAEAGLPVASSDQAPQGIDTVEQLVDLGRADMDPTRRGVIAAGGLFSAALAVPLFADVTQAAEAAPVRLGKATVRIGSGQVESVRKMTDKIADILDELGGAHARPMAGAFLVNTVGPWLRAEASETVRKDMYAAASDLTYLTGWMAMYERDHLTAQDYYTRALELAGYADDHVTYCRTLRGMSLQATNLGYGARALRLADSAAEAAPKAGPRLRAFLTGQQAHAASMVGDHRRARRLLTETETSLMRADNRRESIGGYDQSAYAFHVSHVLYEGKDLPGSIGALQQALKVQPKNERQGRVHFNAVLAQRQLQRGHLDAACESWGRFLDDYEHISSARGDEHFETMRLRLKPHGRARSVRALSPRITEVAALKG
ncbi:MFS transporter [Streptomyces aureoverticillatus]|nr:MFS transporter [Streptomyces aureoverticillatus]